MSTLRDANVNASPTNADIEALRDGLIAELRDLGAILSPEVERAIRTVPRHVFVPEVGLDEAYAAEHSVHTKKDEQGVTLSSVSAARIQASMLEQAEIRPGMRVLEIGSGGYNAALIAELVACCTWTWIGRWIWRCCARTWTGHPRLRRASWSPTHPPPPITGGWTSG